MDHQATAVRAARTDVLIARVGEERTALPLADVVEVLPAVASVPVRDAPAPVIGAFNLRGTPIPLLSLRQRIGLPDLPPDPGHHVVLCRIADRQVGLWTDFVEAVAELDHGDVVPTDEVAPTRHLDGVATLDDDLLLVYDLRKFLAADETLPLDRTVGAAVRGGRQ